MSKLRRTRDETEVGRMSQVEAVISEGRAVVFNLLAAIERYEQSRADHREGDEDK